MSPNLIKFVQFFNLAAPPEMFAMADSPRLCTELNSPDVKPQKSADLVGWMRLFLIPDEATDEPIHYIDPCSAFDMEAKLYYNLVLGRGRWANRCYKLNLRRFDRFPADMRKEIALDVLLRVIVGDGAPWYEAVRNRAGLNATGAVVEWCN